MEKSGKRPKQPNGSRGTKDYLKKNKEAVDAFYKGEANRHRIAKKSCVDCDYITCHPKCEGIYGDRHGATEEITSIWMDLKEDIDHGFTQTT